MSDEKENKDPPVSRCRSSRGRFLRAEGDGKRSRTKKCSCGSERKRSEVDGSSSPGDISELRGSDGQTMPNSLEPDTKKKFSMRGRQAIHMETLAKRLEV